MNRCRVHEKCDKAATNAEPHGWNLARSMWPSPLPDHGFNQRRASESGAVTTRTDSRTFVARQADLILVCLAQTSERHAQLLAVLAHDLDAVARGTTYLASRL